MRYTVLGDARSTILKFWLKEETSYPVWGTPNTKIIIATEVKSNQSGIEVHTTKRFRCPNPF